MTDGMFIGRTDKDTECGVIEVFFTFNERYSIINYQPNIYEQIIKLGSYL
eukprot:CAMPEP_0170505344 /NCGR_PEP_ID=MMETSP0208-20121228/50565_1 /TAXON_ID=197538 /ORGANISM="Strombidium inclinatum, Strain S3" /LENGTH=49 /DNA_ID= /DNA_START= /DNA_END= /DNA_ORIENTATION=